MKRKLVGVTVENHTALELIQDYYRQARKPVPSIPWLVNSAIRKTYLAFLDKTNNKKDSNHGK